MSGGRWADMEQEHRLLRGPPHGQASVAVDRLQRRVSETAGRLGQMSPLTVPENTSLMGDGRRGAGPLAADLQASVSASSTPAASRELPCSSPNVTVIADLTDHLPLRGVAIRDPARLRPRRDHRPLRGAVISDYHATRASNR